MLTCLLFLVKYLKEVARLVIGAMKDTLGHSMLAFARQWMTFVTSKCERGRGTRPRYILFYKIIRIVCTLSLVNSCV